MILEIETLEALSKHKTMSATATSLYVTQSTVSKRIQSLEDKCGEKLVVKNGRYVELTEFALHLIKESSPHITSIKDLVANSSNITQRRVISLGFSESLLSYWGAKILGDFAKENPDLTIEPHAHSSVVIEDKVSSSGLNFAITAGVPSKRAGVLVEMIGHEEMVIVGNDEKPIFCLSTASSTWHAIADQVYAKGIEVTERADFFHPIAYLALNGFCRALIPINIAKSVGFDESDITRTDVYRPIYAVGRKSAFNLDDVMKLVKYFKKRINLKKSL